jgi:aldehyde:ferredoxin oxidoreductase
MKGVNGKILRVNLTTGQIFTEEPSEDYYKLYLGGRGFIIQILLEEVPKGVDPLGPENKLIFALGPITGHPIVGSARNSVGAKSPLTGGFGESEAGGFWNVELKRSGFDAIIVEGMSAKPVYLWINDGNVEIQDASKIWGLDVADTVGAIEEELGNKKTRTTVIGPAGEKLVRYACISNDINHVAGRTGMGAVMGSKKLKAIAVRGTKPPEIANKEKIMELNKWMGQNFKDLTNEWMYGTGLNIINSEASGNLPIKNFNGGPFPGVEKITPAIMIKNYDGKMEGCFGCPIRCKKIVKMDKPWKIDPIYGGPEFETLAAFGPNCGIDNLEAIMKANEICNRYGMDTISAGVSISFAMECFEKGIITIKDTDGLELTFGNAQAMVEMVERIALRKGFGDILAEGTKKAAERIGKGSAEFAMHTKGEEIPLHEPRLKQGMGLHYSVHITGADHVSGIHDTFLNKDSVDWGSVDIAESIPSIEMSPRKARMLYQVSLWRQAINYLGLCNIVPWRYKQIIDITESVTGWSMSYWKLMKAVERGITLARIFNIREGWTAKDDILPSRFATSPSEGPLKGVFIDPQKLVEAQKIYYQMMGWNESGIPTYARLVELKIEWASRYLEEMKNPS